MSCNAIATARAQVTREMLRKLLTDELVSNVVFEFLRRKYTGLNPREVNAWSGVAFVMGEYRININDGAVTVTVSGRQAETRQPCAAIANEITTFLTKTAGLILQSQVRHAVAMKYGIQDEQRASNGALVLSVEL